MCASLSDTLNPTNSFLNTFHVSPFCGSLCCLTLEWKLSWLGQASALCCGSLQPIYCTLKWLLWTTRTTCVLPLWGTSYCGMVLVVWCVLCEMIGTHWSYGFSQQGWSCVLRHSHLMKPCALEAEVVRHSISPHTSQCTYVYVRRSLNVTPPQSVILFLLKWSSRSLPLLLPPLPILFLRCFLTLSFLHISSSLLPFPSPFLLNSSFPSSTHHCPPQPHSLPLLWLSPASVWTLL